MNEIKTAAMPLEKANIKVIPVLVGHNADPRVLTDITTNKGYIVNGTDVKDPDDLAEEILKKIRVGKKGRY